MAVVHFTAPDNRALTALADVASSLGLRGAARELERARGRYGLGAILTETEFRALYASADQCPPRVRPVLDDALVRLDAAARFECDRDAYVKPRVDERRRQRMAELGHG